MMMNSVIYVIHECKLEQSAIKTKNNTSTFQATAAQFYDCANITI
jgi:hypothetical protein